MKKNYFDPEMKVILLQSNAYLLAGSGKDDINEGDPIPVLDPSDSEEDGF
jgi:hypothetical protein